MKNNRKKVYLRHPELSCPENSPKSFLEKFFTSDGAIIFLIPVIVYIWVYAYQIGYLAEFGIPIKFADFTINELLENADFTFITVGIIALIYLALKLLCGYIFRLNNSKVSCNTGLPIFIDLTFLYFIYYFYITGWKSEFSIINDRLFRFDIITVLIFLFILILGNPVFYKSGSFSLHYQNFYNRYFGSNIFKFVNIFIVIYLFFFEYGHYDAHVKEKFYFANTTPECVVLYMRSDSAICAYFDREFNFVFNDFRILYFENEPNLHFQLEAIGRIDEDPLAVYDYASYPYMTSTPTPGVKVTPNILLPMIPTNTINRFPLITKTPIP